MAATPAAVHKSAVPAVLVAVVAWGIGPLLVRGMSVSGYTVALYRMWLGVPAMILAARVWGRPLTASVLRRCIFPGVFFGGSMMMGFVAIRSTSIAHATLIGALTPALVLLGVNRFVGERSDPAKIPAALIAFVGLALVIMNGSQTSGASLSGDLWAAANLLCFTVYFMNLKVQRNDDVDGWSFLAGVFVVGAIVVTPFCVLASSDLTDLVGRDYLYLLAMIAGPGLIGHGLITWASRHLPVGTTSLLTLGSPVVSCLGAWLVYEQTLAGWQIVGAVLVFGGLAATVWDRARNPVAEELVG
ncbi:MAG: DMT family transporter [Actinomycetota bacterium]